MVDFYWEEFKMEKKLISIIVPVFNAEKTLNELYNRTSAVLNNTNYRFEFIFIDDGSKDKSWMILSNLHSENSNVTAIKFTKNFGQHSAILGGLTASTGDLILTMDDDLQHPPEEIPKLLEAYEKTNSDVIYGVTDDKKHSVIHNTGAKAVAITSEYKDHQGSSFRLIKKDLVQKIVRNHQYNFLYLDGVLNWYTSNFKLVNVEHHPRKEGKSGYTFFKLVKLQYQTIINYSAIPLKMITFSALYIALFTFIVGLWFIFKKIFYDAPMGYTSIIVAILFSTSLTVYILGLIGLYVHKIFEFNLQKPTYFSSKILHKKDDH